MMSNCPVVRYWVVNLCNFAFLCITKVVFLHPRPLSFIDRNGWCNYYFLHPRPISFIDENGWCNYSFLHPQRVSFIDGNGWYNYYSKASKNSHFVYHNFIKMKNVTYCRGQPKTWSVLRSTHTVLYTWSVLRSTHTVLHICNIQFTILCQCQAEIARRCNIL